MTGQIADPIEILSTQIRCQTERKLDATEDAFTAIRIARQELDQLEDQLKLMATDKPHLNPGMIHGLDAKAIFTAFGEAERTVSLQRVAHKLYPDTFRQPGAEA